MNELVKEDELLNNYYTPFIKSKLENNQIAFDKQIKELDKQMDRIKNAYIKGILKINDFDKEIKHIEFQRKDLLKKQKEQKQYENLSFTIDDLLILQDEQEVDSFVNPENYLKNFDKWDKLEKSEQQRIIGKYIDNITIEKKDDSIKIVNGNFRESYLKDIRTNHDDYGIPYNFNIFEDDYGYKLNMNHEVRTKEEAKKYFDKLCKIMSDYKFNYYVIDTDDDLKNIKFSSDVEIEKIVRLIALKPDKRFKNQNLKLGVITIDLTNIKDKNGNQLYKGFFEKLKEVNKNELCNI